MTVVFLNPYESLSALAKQLTWSDDTFLSDCEKIREAFVISVEGEDAVEDFCETCLDCKTDNEFWAFDTEQIQHCFDVERREYTV